MTICNITLATMFWTDMLRNANKSNILFSANFYWSDNFFSFYTIWSLYRAFHIENWPDALCLSCVSDFLLARSALCSLLQLVAAFVKNKPGSRIAKQLCPAWLHSALELIATACDLSHTICCLRIESKGRLTRGMFLVILLTRGTASHLIPPQIAYCISTCADT